MATTHPVTRRAPAHGAIRTGLAPNELSAAVLDNLAYLVARTPETASQNDWYMALAYSIRDRLLARWLATGATYLRDDVKVACYLSAEFLIGPQLGNNLINLGIEPAAREAMRSLGQNLDVLEAVEEEPGLGNGGLGRLAACFLDSLATLQIPAIGYGIRYEFGIFDQRLRDGWQVEITDEWLHKGNPWELIRPEISYHVKFGGHTESFHDDSGRYRVRWQPNREVKGVACDIPVLGYRVNTCNTLRLWKSEAVESFDFADFNTGDYYGAVQEKTISETLSKVLYPNDEPEIGKRLRLAQQYFFVSCSLQDMLRLLDFKGLPIDRFADLFAVQLNDTHPAIAVAELMRLLVDERLLPWDQAWEITRRALAYTNHTLLPEALETWGLPLFRNLLPRPLEIIYEINDRFMREVRQRYPDDDARLARLSLIDESGDKRVRMANLATVGCHAVNGVAALHSRLLRETVLRDFAELWPERFHNVTNGVTPRRFMVLSNPSLAQLLDDAVGPSWATDLSQLRTLEMRADDLTFHNEWNRIKLQNKERLARLVHERTGIRPNPQALFDIQVKRIHEYKRQHLNALHIVTLYRRLLANPQLDIAPRCFIFGGKAAPGYHMAKLIIRLINGIADVVNNDPATRDKLQVVFFPDFNVKNAHAIYPAANLSEQISTAGKEASGTGNMKFTLNGALTVGTLDGANVEIREEVGAENFFLFGLAAEQVQDLKGRGYRPRDYYENDGELRGVLDMLADGTFSNGDPHLFAPLLDHLLNHDTYLLLADYRPYVDVQAEVDRAFRDTARWTRMSILNVARAGKFSADRSIQEYCEQIWDTRAVPVQVSEASRERH
ncbi:MAG TPA: glycogen/starch/alpha-glucan phosphorylase [Steroidobacter sp.]|uniref:glycogen/starch/alpha-glucan phosphorylase n=1 Tax=Steroidobacter sp. TaxID=1978227 RepID=UPI002EDAAC55